MTVPILSTLDGPTLREFYRLGYWRDRTIYDVLREQAGRRPGAHALRDRTRRLTYGELLDAVDRFGAVLSRAGVVPGNRLVTWMPDRMESAIALVACSRNGLVCCPSPHRNHTVAEIVALMERMRGAAFIYQSGFGADADGHDIETELTHLGGLCRFIRLDPTGSGIPWAALFGGALEDQPGDIPPPAGDPDRVSYLAFTSGSTGSPKGVMHSDNTLLVTARALSRDWHVGPDSVVYSMSPFCHNLGIGTFLTALFGGSELVLHDLARDESLVDRLVETGTSYLVGVPTHAIDLLAEIKRRDITDFSAIKGFRISGAAVPPDVIADLLRLGVTPQSGYGMTETNAHQYTRPHDDPKRIMETSGPACEGYEIAIWDSDDPDTEVPVGEIGHLGGRGACLMLGYFDDQLATEAAFNALGWFMTGDLGRIDEDGYLTITGRVKEVIIRGGHNINPARIEELAVGHDFVLRAAAVPVADARLGERVCLAVMYRPGNATGAAEIMEHLSGAGLSRFEMPEFYLELDEIPLMSNGKMRKRDILDRIRDGSAVPVAWRSGEKQNKGER